MKSINSILVILLIIFSIFYSYDLNENTKQEKAEKNMVLIPDEAKGHF